MALWDNWKEPKVIVEMELVGPSGGSWSCVVDGVKESGGYIKYKLPDKVTSAIGLACSGRTLDVPDRPGWRPPKVECFDCGDYLVAVSYC